MPSILKPLFRPDVLRPRIKAFELPDDAKEARAKLEQWAELFTSGEAAKQKEQKLLPDFLTDVFYNVLGYTGPAQGQNRYTISREERVEASGRVADAVLGDFRPDQRKPVVVLEGKGPRDPLDRPFAGRRMSAIEQAYQYATNLPCDWIIVTSMRETRLYYKGADQYTCERFDISRLASDDFQFRKFVFLLGAERAAPEDGRSHLYNVLEESEKADRNVTKEYYEQYANMRHDAFSALCKANPEIDRHDILTATQKLLDRILFSAFCEDRGLLPAETIKNAYEYRDPYNPHPIWDNFRALFGFINNGNADLLIPRYNGGLFEQDPVLDNLAVPDDVCAFFKVLGDYDYRPVEELEEEPEDEPICRIVDVDILGHIFEQSITDLEKLRDELDGITDTVDLAKHKSRRKKEGAFYTPEFITRYIVEQTLGSVLRERFEKLRDDHAKRARGTAGKVLEDPAAYDATTLNSPQKHALIAFWLDWQIELAKLRVLDPACGSGAFLIEAYDQLYAHYQTANHRLEELRGSPELFDLSRQILQQNLYGVDINEEAVEICRLSLWIKTAERGKVLTDLDHNIRVGNSVVDDPAVHPKAFKWREAFPEVFEDGGFDVVVANPPYIRQELLSPYKAYLRKRYLAFHGMADIYVYFYELGVKVLRPGGRMSYVVTNKWMKAGYGEPLRRFFAEETWLESVVDLGHAKQVFKEADVFPSVVVVRRPLDGPPPQTTRICAIHREQLRVDNLSRQIAEQGFEIERSHLDAGAWHLERQSVLELMTKLRKAGKPLSEFANTTPYRGLLTGHNKAFLIDKAARDELIRDDPGCSKIIRPCVRGQDVRRWSPCSPSRWMIVLRSSADHDWPWSGAGERAEQVFAKVYPSIHRYMAQHKERLCKRRDKGRFWWELRSCSYYDEFENPKILYQVIQYHPSFAFDDSSMFGNDKTFLLPSRDYYLLGVLNSPLMWWHNFRYLPHMKDEALTPQTFKMEVLPIAEPSDQLRALTEKAVSTLIDGTRELMEVQAKLLDWLRVEFDIEKPSKKLQSPVGLTSDEFIDEVKRGRGKRKSLTSAKLQVLREEYSGAIEPRRTLAVEGLRLERQIGDWVNKAYGLTLDEVQLMWDTAPPRMPIPRPESS